MKGKDKEAMKTAKRDAGKGYSIEMSFGGWGKTVALFSVVLNNGCRFGKNRVIKGSEGLFVSWASVKDSGGRYQSIVAFPTKEAREAMEGEILALYRSEVVSTPRAQPRPQPETTDLQGREVSKYLSCTDFYN